jgi:hypothetical protein
MADKKITALGERLVPIDGTDLLLLVANVVPASQATNYKVQVKNFLSNCQIQLAGQANGSALRVTANVVANVNTSFVVAAGTFRLDTGNTTAIASKAYGVIVDHTIVDGSYSRGAAPVAFIGLQETVGSNTTATTTYLLDAGIEGANVSEGNSSTANTGTILSVTADKAATHTLKIRVNGSTYYLLASNTAPV